MRKLLHLLGINTLSNEEIVNQYIVKPPEFPAVEETSIQEPPTDVAQKALIAFMVDENGHLEVDLKWSKNPSKALSESVGIVLGLMNSGKLSHNLKAIIANTIASNVSYKDFLNSVLSKWEATAGKHTQVVKPSEVFQVGKQIINSTIKHQLGTTE